ncbi:MAG TPA: sigma-70 family RNA polymerase sigma factor [Candidatus Paceibacterota bacterium]
MLSEANNKEKEFGEAYEQYSDALFKFIAMRIKDRERAKDMLQDCFTRTWQAIVDGKEVENMRAFLYKVARNLVIDEYRSHKSVSLDEMTEETGYEVASRSGDNPSIGAEVGKIREALEKLPEEYREVVSMRYIDELMPVEISEILGESANAISVRINRGVVMLRETLQIEK